MIAASLVLSAIASPALANAAPSDEDGDGLANSTETDQLGTDPYNIDPDGDGVNDGLDLYQTKTNPLVADAPAPAPSGPGGRDTDGDGLSNKDELAHFTNVFLPDTDFDGVNDFDEIKIGTNPLNRFSK